MLIQPTTPTDSTLRTTGILTANLLFTALFLCPRPLSLEGSDFAPLPYRANPLVPPSVFLGIALGVSPASLKQVVPALQNHNTPKNAYLAIISALIDTADDSVELAPPHLPRTRGRWVGIDRTFTEVMSAPHDTPVAREYDLNRNMSEFMAAAGGTSITTELLARHKRLISLPARMPSRKVAELV